LIVIVIVIEGEGNLLQIKRGRVLLYFLE
jgi:hypothetical protein